MVRELTTRVPIWVRIFAVMALMLAGIVTSSMLLEAKGVGGGANEHAVTPSTEGPPAGVPEDGGRRGHTPPFGSGH
jgi:hypothetical protein